MEIMWVMISEMLVHHTLQINCHTIQDVTVKIHARFLTIALLIICNAALPVTTAHASPPGADLVPNPAAEQYLLDELRATGYVDLEANFAREDSVISGELLLFALKDPEVQSKPLIFIRNAIIADDLFASDITIPASLVFNQVEFNGQANFFLAQLRTFEAYDSNFKGGLVLEDATISRNLRLTGNEFGGNASLDGAQIDGYVLAGDNAFLQSLSFLRANIHGNVDLRNNTINENLNFYGAHTVGEFLLDNSRILGVEALPWTTYPVEFWYTTIDGLASFNDVYFEGSAYFKDFRAENTAQFVGVTFNSRVDFENASIARDADFSGATFNDMANFNGFYTGNFALFNGNADFTNATVIRQADFTDAQFNGSAIFDYFTANRFMDFINTTFNQDFSLYYASVAWPILKMSFSTDRLILKVCKPATIWNLPTPPTMIQKNPSL